MWDNTEQDAEPRKQGFADDRQVGNVVWRLFWVAIIAFILFGTFGCGGVAMVRQSSIEGIALVEHIDTEDSPCGRGSHLTACYKKIDGVGHVWYSSVTPEHFIRHETIGHGRGMQHTAWAFDTDKQANCAMVYSGTTEYPIGSKICITPRSETIYSTAWSAKS